MCFKAPKPPKVYVDPALKSDQLDARDAAAAIRAADKQRRTDERIAGLSGRFGARALSGSAAGVGAPLQRSLFTQVS